MPVTTNGVDMAIAMMRRHKKNAPPPDPQFNDEWVLLLNMAERTVAEGIGDDDIREVAAQFLMQPDDPWFPEIGHFIGMVKQYKRFGTIAMSDDDRANIAWLRVVETVQRIGTCASWTVEDLGGDGHALEAVSRIGLDELGQMKTTERHRFKMEFIAAYKACVDMGATAKHLRGSFERENLLNGRLITPELMGRPVSKTIPELPAQEMSALPARKVESAEDLEAFIEEIATSKTDWRT